MKKQAAIEHFGSVAKLAEALKITPAAVYQWGDDVPVGRDYQIHVLSGGAVPLDEPAAGAPRTREAAA